MKLVSPAVIVFIGVFFTSFSAIFVRSVEAPPLIAAMYRMWFSVFLLLPVLAADRIRIRRRRRRGVVKAAGAGTPGEAAADNSGSHQPAAAEYVPQADVRWPKPTLIEGVLCVVSGIFLAAHFWVWFESLKLTSIASSTVLVDTHPIFVLIFGFLLLKEKVSRRGVFFVLIAVLGMAALSLGDFARGIDTLGGDLLAVASAAAVSGYLLIGRKVRRRMSAPVYATTVYFVAAATLTVFAAAGKVSLFEYTLHDYLFFLAMAFFCTLLGHTLFNWALRYLKTSFISTSVLLEPLFATLLGMIIFKEIPGLSTAAGGAVVLFGVFMFVREEGKMIKPVARGTAIADGIRADIPLSADMRLLDIGAGGGEVSIELAPYVKSILAIDTSEQVLGRLREKIEQDQVLERKFETRCHDLSIEPLSSDSFDLVMASMTLHHVEKTDSLLDNLAAIVRPGGYVAIADLETEDGSFHGATRAVPHHGFDTQLLAERLTRLGFDVIGCREIFQIERGERRYPVFLLTGRKE